MQHWRRFVPSRSCWRAGLGPMRSSRRMILLWSRAVNISPPRRDCMPCHTGDKTKPYAGGLSFNTPFGVMYSVNITSDKTNGIGTWTYEDFKAAVHDGIRKDGAYLYPASPSTPTHRHRRGTI